jgi:hypothetical protein
MFIIATRVIIDSYVVNSPPPCRLVYIVVTKTRMLWLQLQL